jgi:hypothetical protein
VTSNGYRYGILNGLLICEKSVLKVISDIVIIVIY